MTDKTNPEVSVVPTQVIQADREVAAIIDGWQKLCTDEEPLGDDIRAGKLDDAECVRIIARHRLAHQTPPATEPVATVGEVERLREALEQADFDLCVAIDQLSEGRPSVASDLLEAKKKIAATLHTPPPVAQESTVAFVQHWMMSGDHEPTQWDRDFAAAIEARTVGITDALVKHMASRFLMWKLPQDFWPDGGVSFINVHKMHWPVGTNLLNAAQAEDMVRHMLADVTPPPVATAAVDAETLRLAKDELRALAALIKRPPLDDVQLTQDVALRCASAIRVVLAATPPPVATATVVDAGCTVPPAGWRCTRAAGHSGPCAAVPTEAPPTTEDAWRSGFAAAEEVLGAHGSEWLLGAIENAWAEYAADHALAATPTPPAGDR